MKAIVMVNIPNNIDTDKCFTDSDVYHNFSDNAEFETADVQLRFKGDVVATYEGIKLNPLPKNHGKIIDADAIDYYEVERYGEPHYMCRKRHIDGLPTIIEADKAESEDKE